MLMTGWKPIPRWLNVLSLDAVLVALSWHWLLTGDRTSLSQIIALAAIVWLVYTADRYLDARSLIVEETRLLRHDFARQHAGALRLIWIIVALVTMMVLPALPRPVLRSGACLASLVFVYAVMTHRVPLSVWRSVKPHAAGGLFALGVSLPIWSSISGGSLQAILTIMMFSGLCIGNCQMVSMVDRMHLRDIPINRAAIFITMSLSIAAWIALVRVGGMDRVTYAAAGSIAALLMVRDLPQPTPTVEPVRWHPVSFWADAALAVPAMMASAWP